MNELDNNTSGIEKIKIDIIIVNIILKDINYISELKRYFETFFEVWGSGEAQKTSGYEFFLISVPFRFFRLNIIRLTLLKIKNGLIIFLRVNELKKYTLKYPRIDLKENTWNRNKSKFGIIIGFRIKMKWII